MAAWTPGVIARLGKDTDAAIARKLKISVSAVSQRRRRLGIPRSPQSRRESRRWTPAEDALLGTMSDREAAREIGVSRETVEGRRLELGVPSFGPAYRRGGLRRPADLAGARYEAARRHGQTVVEIARQYRVSASAVRKALLRYERRAAAERRRRARPERATPAPKRRPPRRILHRVRP